ncbi:MAG: response regulator transcription factor [Dehalococcoidia bacterium]
MPRTKVLVVDDHPLLRRGVMDVLGLQEQLVVIGEAGDGVEALEKARELAPDVIVMDLEMPNMSGLEATAILQQELPDAKILIFTVSDKQADLFSAMRVGARGYILKNAAAAELLRSVFHIAEGGVIISPDMAAKLLSELPSESEAPEEKSELEVLTQRESQVLHLVAQGSSNKEIASALYISENTVKTHMRNIMDKLHLANRSQAAAYGARHEQNPPVS